MCSRGVKNAARAGDAYSTPRSIDTIAADVSRHTRHLNLAAAPPISTVSLPARMLR
jgi:hypothetical protein